METVPCTSGLSKLMIVHGNPYADTTTKSEIIDIENDKSQCEDMTEVVSVKFLGSSDHNSVGGYVSDRPIVCVPRPKDFDLISGTNFCRDLELSNDINECFTMNKQGIWEWIMDLEYPRLSSFGIAFPEEQSHSLWVSGGFYSIPSCYIRPAIVYDSTEFVSPNGQLSKGPDLPYMTEDHCFLDTRNGNIMLTGGREKVYDGMKLINDIHHADAWMLNIAKGTWTEGPSLAYNRHQHSCGLLQDSIDGAAIAVVAGGLAKLSAVLDTAPGHELKFPLRETELLPVSDFITDRTHWLSGPNLPIAMTDTFQITTADMKQLIIGGGWTRADFGALQENVHPLYRLQCFSLKCDWSKMKQELKYPRPRRAVAILLPSDYEMDCEYTT